MANLSIVSPIQTATTSRRTAGGPQTKSRGTIEARKRKREPVKTPALLNYAVWLTASDVGRGGGVGRIGTFTGPLVIGPGSADELPVAVRLNDVAVSVGSTVATTEVPSADGASVTSGSSTVHVIVMDAPAGKAAFVGTNDS